MRTGNIDSPIALARDSRPTEDRAPTVTVADRRGPARSRLQSSGSRDPNVKIKGQLVDSIDLDRGKSTLTGAALVKTLLGNFDANLIAQVLRASEEPIRKIADSNLLQLAPMLSHEDRFTLVGMLEKRIEATGSVPEPLTSKGRHGSRHCDGYR